MSYKSELIRKLFSDRLKKDELKDLSEIDMIERKMKVQWEEQNPIAENSERVDPEIGDYIWAKIVKEYKVRSKRKSIRQFYYPLAAACVALVAVLGGWLFYVNSDFFVKEEFAEVVATRNMLYQLPDSSEVWMYPNSSIRFAKNFNKELSASDIKFYGKIHFERSRSNNELNMHCHLIISRKDQANKKKLSPLTNHKNTKNGIIKGGFNRVNLFQKIERGFDYMFCYDRQQFESFDYHNTMKNGSISELLKQQEQELQSYERKTKINQDRNKENLFAKNHKNNHPPSSPIPLVSLEVDDSYVPLEKSAHSKKKKWKRKKI